MAIKKRAGAASATRKQAAKTAKKPTATRSATSARARIAPKKKPASRANPASKSVKKTPITTRPPATGAVRAAVTGKRVPAPAPRAVTSTRKEPVVEATPASAWTNVFEASPWAKLRRGATQQAQPVAKRAVAAKSAESAEPAPFGDVLSAAPWAKQNRTGTASAVARSTRQEHARRRPGEKGAGSGEFTDLMAASPWATKPTPAFKRRSAPENAPAARSVSRGASSPPTLAATKETVTPAPRRDAPSGNAPIPVASHAASIAPPPARRAPRVDVPTAAPTPAARPRPEGPAFAPRPTPVSRPARDAQRDELGEAIRELAGTAAESQFSVKKSESSGLSDAERLRSRLAERQRSISRAVAEQPPRFRPKQRAAIPKRPVAAPAEDVHAAQRHDAPQQYAPRPQVNRPIDEADSYPPAEMQKKKLEKTIPIEGLGWGVFNALSNGMGRIVGVGKQSISGIALGAKDGVRLVSGFFKGRNPTTRPD